MPQLVHAVYRVRAEVIVETLTDWRLMYTLMTHLHSCTCTHTYTLTLTLTLTHIHTHTHKHTHIRDSEAALLSSTRSQTKA